MKICAGCGVRRVGGVGVSGGLSVLGSFFPGCGGHGVGGVRKGQRRRRE